MSSFLYKELTFDEISLIVSSALNSKLLSVSLLSGGMFNTTYLINTDNIGQDVLRVGPVNRHLLMPFEHKLMEAENYVYTLCHENNLPASEVLALDVSKSLIDRDFMIVKYIPSSAMYGLTLEDSDRKRIYRDIGCAVRRMHDITANRFGRIADVSCGGGFERWSECMINELTSWKSVAMPTGLYSDSEYERIYNSLNKLAPVLDEIRTPHLVHTDLWLGNVLMSQNGSQPEFAAIIDADRAMWGDPELDFSAIRWTYNEPSFWEGYRSQLSPDKNSCTRRSIYAMMWGLLDSYVYLAEYDQPDNTAKTKAATLKHLEAIENII